MSREELYRNLRERLFFFLAREIRIRRGGLPVVRARYRYVRIQAARLPKKEAGLLVYGDTRRSG